jgi:hypothetical protein
LELALEQACLRLLVCGLCVVLEDVERVTNEVCSFSGTSMRGVRYIIIKAWG